MQLVHGWYALTIGRDVVGCSRRSANAVGPSTRRKHMNAIQPANDVFQLLEQVKQLQAQLAQANKPRKLTLKVSEKGAVSVYGMGKFPVTLYAGQWERLLGAQEEITSFIEANRALLAVKV